MQAPFDMRKRRYAVLACLSVFALAVSGAVAFAGSPKSSNSEAVTTGSFSDECRDFEADAEKLDGKPKDISHVELHYADGRVVKDEKVDSPHYEIDEGPGDEKTHVFVKSGTTTKRFDCDGNGGGDPECSDGIDNDGDKRVDYPEDPGCDSPEDGSESPNPECSDGVDNDGDKKVDANDPGCHTDGDPNNPDSYDPRDDDETDSDGGDGAFSCRASALRLENSTVIGGVLGDPFEPFVANANQDPCTTDDGSSPLQGGTEQDFGSASVKAAYATTDDAAGADANAGVAHVLLAGEPGFVEATVLDASAAGQCDGDTPTLSGESTVATLNLNGNEIVIPPDNAHHEISLGVGTLHVNYQQLSDDGRTLTVRALWLDVDEPAEQVTGDVVIGEAIADYSGNPC